MKEPVNVFFIVLLLQMSNIDLTMWTEELKIKSYIIVASMSC